MELEKLDRREKPKHKLASCSQTQWIWTVVDEQTGNLNLNLRNKDWVGRYMLACILAYWYTLLSIERKDFQNISALPGTKHNR